MEASLPIMRFTYLRRLSAIAPPFTTHLNDTSTMSDGNGGTSKGIHKFHDRPCTTHDKVSNLAGFKGSGSREDGERLGVPRCSSNIPRYGKSPQSHTAAEDAQNHTLQASPYPHFRPNQHQLTRRLHAYLTYFKTKCHACRHVSSQIWAIPYQQQGHEIDRCMQRWLRFQNLLWVPEHEIIE
eukprot:1136972-Pelagomonas_calceolata.AAC.8